MREHGIIRRSRTCLTASVLLLMCGLHAQQQEGSRGAPAESATVAPPGTDPMAKPGAAQGQTLFSNNCAGCHGTLAKGGIGPSLIASPLVRHDVKGELIEPVVHEGRSTMGMPAFPNLSKDEVAQVVAFLHARIAATNSNTFRPPATSFALNKLLTGNATAGEQFFKANCASCHSSAGDLKGIATRLAPTELESRMLMPRAGKPTGTVTLSTGKTVQGEIMRNDGFDVTVKESNGHQSSWPKADIRHVGIDDPLRGHTALLSTYTDGDIHNVFAYLETLR